MSESGSRMRGGVLAIVFAAGTLVSLNSAAQLNKPTREDATGRWVGEYTLDHQRVFLVVRLKKENEKWVGTYNRPVLDWENDLDLRNLQIDRNQIAFNLGDASSVIHVETRWVANSLQGTVKAARVQGKIVLEPTAILPKEYLDTLAGNYEAAGGSYVIERENNYLCFLNRRTGRSGRLVPASETQFWTGPGIDIWYPEQTWFEFVRRSDGQPTQLKVRRGRTRRLTLDRKVLYTREEVEFENAGTKLSGTLRIPAEGRRGPALVILHGSNYQTRGGQYGALAFVGDQFARNGFAVLNYDKRGTGKSGGKRDDDPELLSGDAAAAVGLLRTRPEVNPGIIGLWGISQGGILEPLVAQKTDRLAFFINVSGAVVNTNEQEIQRTELKLRADGFSKDEVNAAVHLQRVKFRYACKRDNWDEYETVLRAAQGKAWLPDPYIGPPESRGDDAWDFWKCGVDPGKYWESVRVPVLYLQGEFEAYSKPLENLARLRQAMQVAGNPHFEHKLLPGAEHSMFKARTGGEKELPFLNTYVDGYFPLLTDWAKRQADSALRHP